MTVPTAITDLSSTAASNSPAGSENVFPNLDDYLRAGYKFSRDLYDGTLTISGKTFASPLGAVGAPTYSFTGDTDTGFWSPAANTLAASTSGAETWRTLSTGEFLVKRTTTFDAAYKFQVGDGAGDYRALFNPNTTFAIGVRNGASTNGVYFIGASAAATPDLLFLNTGGTENFRMTSDGRLYGTSLHNNSGSVSGASLQYIASGTYTPTLTAVSNISSATGRVSQWMRIGNVVTVSGVMDLGWTSANTLSEVGISLPIASTFTNKSNLAGLAQMNPNAAGQSKEAWSVYADTTNARATMKTDGAVLPAVSPKDFNFQFTYVIL
jgi:hypothetical protein